MSDLRFDPVTRRTFLQTIHGRVFAEHIISHLGQGHRGAHAWRRAGHRIAA